MTKPKKLSDFRPQRRNANLHTPRGLGMLDNSIAKDGWIGAITVAADGETFDGSTRLETVYSRFGEDVEPIVVRSNGDRPIIHIREDIPSADDERAVKLAIAANRIAQVDLNFDAAIIDEIAQEVDISDLFTDAELSELMSSLDTDFDPPTEEEDEESTADLLDKVESGAIEPWFKLGDIIQLGRHKIACGDSTIEENVKKLLGDRAAVLCHADPPYGMGKESDGVLNDNLYAGKLDAFQMQWWKACRPFLANNGSAYIWGNTEDLWRLWYSGGLKDSERLTLRNEIVWHKGGGGFGVGTEAQRCYFPTERCLFFMLGEQGFNNNADNYWDGWEPIRSYLDTERVKSGLTTAQCNEICGKKNMTQSAFTRGGFRLILQEDYEKLKAAANGKAFKRDYEDLKRDFYSTRAYFDNAHDNMTDVWEFSRVHGEERWGHATPKPVDMICRIYKSSSDSNGIIYSPFLGSGTDVIAAQKMEGDRTVAGFELSPSYIEVICQRYSAFTGENPKLVGSLFDS